MAARLLAPAPTGRHARLSTLDRWRTALRRSAMTARALPRAIVGVVAAMACLGFALGFTIAGVVL
ncbi:hypothetical protein [Amycolatopsis albispora]|nr:hypothetical protein [Amycolatopsis albispora]